MHRSDSVCDICCGNRIMICGGANNRLKGRCQPCHNRFDFLIGELIEQVADNGAGDGMLDIGAPLTAHVICEQLGFDWSEVGAEKVAIWTKAVLDQIGRMQSRDDMLVNAAQMCELQNFIIRYIRAREKEPRDDMITDLVQARLDDGENPQLSFTEQVATIRAFLESGASTAAGLRSRNSRLGAAPRWSPFCGCSP